MSGPRPPLTTHRRLALGEVLHDGASGAYRAIEITEGEPHVVRGDLGAPDPGHVLAAGRPLLSLVHLTDLQLADVQSPTRFE